MARSKSASELARSHRQAFEATDSRSTSVPADRLLIGARGRDPAGQSARLATQFIDQNRSTLDRVGVSARSEFDGNNVQLVFDCSTTIGAVPLRSPVTGRFDHGLVIRPRFEWSGLGKMLAQMGWRIVPEPLEAALLPQSDRRIPRWVIASIVVLRLERLLRELQRRFEYVTEDRSAPKGHVDWSRYAQHSAGRARLLQVPCTFPDLRDDRSLRSAIRFTLIKQEESLSSLRGADAVTSVLLAKCRELAREVNDVAPRRPGTRELDGWLRGPLKSPRFRGGIQAIEWTVDERGLAGISDLQGLPWSMPMEQFFEAWSETVLAAVARQIGGVVRTGRQRATVTPLWWDPPYTGSQKSLVPDVMLDRGDLSVIVDAKYKEHFEELQFQRWHDVEDSLRERHRADLLQVLAYANVVSSRRVVVCLAYPCSRSTWQSLKERDRLFHRASIATTDHQIQLWLTAFPMGERLDDVAEPFIHQLRRLDAA